MNENTVAELYLSFASLFYRPCQDISEHLEELIDLWREERIIPDAKIDELLRFCIDYPVGTARLDALWEHYIPLFETGTVEAPPYASVYASEDGLVMGPETFAVQRVYETAGYGMGEQAESLPDHLAVELEFAALLARDGEVERLEEFRQKHLLPFLSKILPLIRETRRPVYAHVAEILENWQLNLKKEGDSVG